MGNFISSFDAYAACLQNNFDSGQVAFNDHGVYKPRVNKNALGYSVQKTKSRLAVQLRKRISKYSEQLEGGVQEEVTSQTNLKPFSSTNPDSLN